MQDAAPLKVCRKCSVAVHTSDDACAGCGHPYAGRRSTARTARILIGLGIAVVCVGAGIALTNSGGKSTLSLSAVRRPLPPYARSRGLTYQDAYDLRLGTPYATVVKRFGPPLPNRAGQPLEVGRSHCFYYAYTGHPEAMFQLCFRGKRGLVTLATRLAQAGS